ncbi:MAG: hypothetical protein GY801_02425 [bacterium]|nr:hypothetical protein [bacterium]
MPAGNPYGREIWALAFSPDCRRLAAHGYKALRVWELDFDELLRRGCEWLTDYVQSNPDVSEDDRAQFEEVRGGLSA